MKGKLAFVLGAGIGYVVGTRGGRQEFERIKGWALDAWHDPRVQSTVEDLESSAARFAKDQGAVLKDKAVNAVKSAFSRSDADEDPEADLRTARPSDSPVTPPPDRG